jgi:replicative DNA helicase
MNNDALLEAKVIGAILQKPDLFAKSAHLGKDAFHDQMHATIYACISSSSEQGMFISPASIALNFNQQISAVGGLGTLEQIASQGHDLAASFPQAVEKLRELHQWRKIVDITARLNLATQQKERSPDEILSGIKAVADKMIMSGRETSRTKTDVARAAIQRAREVKETITTGIDTLDYLMQGGLQKNRLYGIGGLYGRGKTILLGSVSNNLNLQAQPHLFITMETEPEDIEIRNASTAINQNASVLFDQDDPDHEDAVNAAEKNIERMDDYTHYEFAPGATMNEIHRMIIQAKSKYGIKGFIIDYLQLIQGREKGQSEIGFIDSCCNKLAAICRQEGIWGVLTCQVDENGKISGSPTGLLKAASLYVRLARDEDAQAAYFVTEKSNYTRYADTGNESVPGMIFDMASGPHFRNTEDIDMPTLAEEQSGNIEV